MFLYSEWGYNIDRYVIDTQILDTRQGGINCAGMKYICPAPGEGLGRGGGILFYI